MSYRPLPEAEVLRRRKAMERIIRPHAQVDGIVDFLIKVKRVPPEKIRERVKRMKKAGVPFIGLYNKLGASNPRFEDMIAKYAKHNGMSQRQVGVFDFFGQERTPENLRKMKALRAEAIAEKEVSVQRGALPAPNMRRPQGASKWSRK